MPPPERAPFFGKRLPRRPVVERGGADLCGLVLKGAKARRSFVARLERSEINRARTRCNFTRYAARQSLVYGSQSRLVDPTFLDARPPARSFKSAALRGQ